MAIIRSDIINTFYSNLDLQKQGSTTIPESFMEIMKRILKSGEDILISGFGKFCVKEKAKGSLKGTCKRPSCWKRSYYKTTVE